VTRKVDSSGAVSFAGSSYPVGNASRRRQVQVAVVGDTVEISIGTRLIRTPRSNTTAPASTARWQPRWVATVQVALVDTLGGGIVLVLRVVPRCVTRGVARTLEARVVTPHSVQTFDPGVGIEPRVE